MTAYQLHTYNADTGIGSGRKGNLHLLQQSVEIA